MNSDTLLEIAMQADYQTTRNLLQTYPDLFANVNVWAKKCDPTRPYIEGWTAEDNYRVQKTNQQRQRAFAILLHNDDDDNVGVDSYLYENSPALLSIRKTIGNYAVGHKHALPRFFYCNVDHQILVVHGTNFKVIQGVSTMDEALAVMIEQRTPSASYYVVDFSKLTPVFLADERPLQESTIIVNSYYDSEDLDDLDYIDDW